MSEKADRVRLKKVLDIVPKESDHNEPALVLVILESEKDDIRQQDICTQLRRQVNNKTLTMEDTELMLDYYQGLGWMSVQTTMFNEWILPDIDDLATMLGGLS